LPTGIKYWKEEIKKAKLYQNKNARLDKWRDSRKWYRNEYPESLVSVNKIFGIGRAMIPQLYFKAPTMLVRSRQPNMGNEAKVLESVDAWLITHIGFKLQVKYAILDAFLTNIGVIKIGYNSISTELPAPDDENLNSVAEMLGSTPGEVMDEMANKKWSYHDFIKPDCPWAIRIRPQDVLVPWGFVDEHESPWMAFRVVRPLVDVKADPIYSQTNSLVANIKIDGLENNGAISPNMFRQTPSKSEFVELYEIWDKRDGTIRVLSEDHDRWLRNEEHGLPIRGLPVAILRFNPDGEDFWGVADVEQIRKQQNELNENRTHELESKRLANVKGIIDTNVIPPDEANKLQSGKPGPLIMANGPPGPAFAEFQGSRIPSDLFRVDEIIDKDIRETIGFGRNQQGEYSARNTTATEANIVQAGNELRADERRDQVADLIVEVFQDKVHPMIFAYWTQERVIEVTAMGGWVKYTGAQIKGDYSLKCVADSSLPLTKAQEQQMAIQAFQLFRGDMRVKQRELYLTVARSFQDLFPDPEQILLSDEEVQQMQQMQAQAQSQQEAGAQDKEHAQKKDLANQQNQHAMQQQVLQAVGQAGKPTNGKP
jgi:hypothetical protein